MRGFSLTEVLITVLILSFILGGLYALLITGNNSFSIDLGLLDLQQQARRAMDGMVREMRQAGGSSYPVTVSVGSQEAIFSIPGIPNIRYYLDTATNKIMRQQPSAGGATRILANNIASLNFCCCSNVDCSACDATCSDPDLVSIRLSAAKTVMLKNLLFSLTEKVRLRNE